MKKKFRYDIDKVLPTERCPKILWFDKPRVVHESHDARYPYLISWQGNWWVYKAEELRLVR